MLFVFVFNSLTHNHGNKLLSVFSEVVISEVNTRK